MRCCFGFCVCFGLQAGCAFVSWELGHNRQEERRLSWLSIKMGQENSRNSQPPKNLLSGGKRIYDDLCIYMQDSEFQPAVSHCRTLYTVSGIVSCPICHILPGGLVSPVSRSRRIVSRKKRAFRNRLRLSSTRRWTVIR